MIRFDPWCPGAPGVGYLVRSPSDESLRLELFVAYNGLNPIALIMRVARLHGIAADQTERLLACVIVRADRSFSLPPQLFAELSDRERATMVEWVEPRLRWEGRS